VLRPSRFSTQRKARVQSVPGTNRGQVNAPPLSEGESAREVRFAKRDACMSRMHWLACQATGWLKLDRTQSFSWTCCEEAQLQHLKQAINQQAVWTTVHLQDGVDEEGTILECSVLS